MSQYAYGTDEEHIVIRLRAGRGDLTECILHYGDSLSPDTGAFYRTEDGSGGADGRIRLLGDYAGASL